MLLERDELSPNHAGYVCVCVQGARDAGQASKSKPGSVCESWMTQLSVGVSRGRAARLALLKPLESFPSPQHLHCGSCFAFTSACSGNMHWEGSWQS